MAVLVILSALAILVVLAVPAVPAVPAVLAVLAILPYHAYEIAYGRRPPMGLQERHVYKRYTSMRDMPVRDTPMKWSMGETRL